VWIHCGIFATTLLWGGSLLLLRQAISLLAKSVIVGEVRHCMRVRWRAVIGAKAINPLYPLSTLLSHDDDSPFIVLAETKPTQALG
jgi:hypothetical protein